MNWAVCCLCIHNCDNSFIERDQTYSGKSDITKNLSAEPLPDPLILDGKLESKDVSARLLCPFHETIITVITMKKKLLKWDCFLKHLLSLLLSFKMILSFRTFFCTSFPFPILFSFCFIYLWWQ